MSMTYVNNETLAADLGELIEEWNFDNFQSTKLVQPGQWDDTFNLQDLEYIYDHIDITQ
jgi:hypothetical protein